jgi:hypothetical protein
MFVAFITSFGDVGTSSRMQARALGVTAVGGTLMPGLGQLIEGPW